MSGRKKKHGGGAPAPKASSADKGFGTLGAQLGDSAKRLAEAREARARAEREREEARRNAPPPKRKLTEAELMEEAFRAAGETATGAAKFLGEGFDASDVEIVGARSAQAAPRAAESAELTRDDLVFLEAMAAEVERMDSGREALRTHEWGGAAWRTDVELASLTDRELKYLELTPAHRDLLRRARREETEVLNLRHWGKADAIRQLEAFVIGSSARRLRYVRIIHGKGRQSVDGPVLKPAVIAWCEGAGTQWVRSWAPEVDRTGQYGSLVLELHRPR